MDFDSSIPIYLQVIDAIKKQFIQGKIKPGDQLPSTRALALDYDVNTNTAARIYKELELQNICFTKRGLGTFITESEERLLEIKSEMANKVIDTFIHEMSELGFSYRDMLNIIKEREMM